MLQFILTVILSSTFAFSQPEQSVGALYSITNDPRGSNVIINSIGRDGRLSYAGSVPIWGRGQYGIFARGPQVAPGGLFSQGTIAVCSNLLFVANIGSNTVSMFSINQTDPTKIEMVGEPVSSGGEFPVALAVSSETGDVCVLNGGKINGLYCYTVDSTYGMSPRGEFINLGPNLTTPPVGPGGTASYILFSQDGTKLRASIKGIPSATAGAPPSAYGYIATWDVAYNGSLSPTFTLTIPDRDVGLWPFGMSSIPYAPNALFVADPFLGAVVYDFTKPEATFKPLHVDGEVTICWVVYSERTNSFWVPDPNANRINEIYVDRNTLNPTLNSSIPLAATENPTDIVLAPVLDEEYLFVLSPAATSFNVISLKNDTAEVIQTYNFGNEANGVNFTPVNTAGAAVFLI